MHARIGIVVAILALVVVACPAADDVVTPPGLAVGQPPAAGDDSPPTDPARDLERLAASRATWEKARDAADGNYTYEVPQVFMMSRQTTRIVVKQGKVVERSFEQFVQAPGIAAPGGGPPAPKTVWTERGDEIGTHGDGAAPPRTVDELYDAAAKMLATPKPAFHERSLGIDDRGLLHHCYDRNTRIADDVPFAGVLPIRILIAVP